MWLQVKDIAEREGLSRQTIQKLIREGHYKKVKQTPGGHYRVWIDLGEPEVTLYCRVSTHKQKTSLETQENLLKDFRPEGDVIHDIGSGFNFERRGFKTILERSLKGIPQHVVATSRDRIARAGFPLVEKIIELSGGRIEILDEEDVQEEKFNIDELISFITSFVNSYYGKRSSKRKKDKNSNTKDQILPKE